MPVVTRRQIKTVENGMRARMEGLQRARMGGLGSLGQFETIIGIASQAGDTLLKSLLDFLTGKTGQLKVSATQFAESMVKLMYGLNPDCRLPQPGTPIVANTPNPLFCAGSVAGLIERCQITQASMLLNSIKQQFAEKTRKVNGQWQYEEGPYIYNWLQQYGNNDFSNLSSKIMGASACPSGGGGGGGGGFPLPGGTTCPPGYTYNSYTQQCNTTTGGGSGISSTTMMLFGGVAILAIFLMRR